MTPVLTIRRLLTGDHGTFGQAVLVDKSGAETWHAFTLEDDWKQNRKGESCIPAGRYRAFFRTPENTPVTVRRMGVYELVGVPNRTAILIHAGNTEEDTEGCILVGERTGELAVAQDEDTGAKNVRKGAVLASRDALEGLHRATGQADLLVVIDWDPGVGEREGET